MLHWRKRQSSRGGVTGSFPAVTEPAVLIGVEDGVGILTLNRADTRNPLTDTFVDELVAALLRLRDDDRTRAIVVISATEAVFSAGGDLAAHLAQAPLVHKHADKRRFPALFSLMRELGKPLIAAVGGHCLAGGLGLALACDLVIATEDATFGTPEIDIGLFPFIVMPLLARNVPSKHALQLMLLGERIDAVEAHRLGFVNRIVPRGELAGAAREWAARLAAKSPLLLRLGKDAFYRQESMAFADAQHHMLGQLMLAFSTDDLHEGINAFFERRPPQWSGR
jgi:enoyl-CoA hydratase